MSALIVILIVVALLMMSLRHVPEDQAFLVHRFGRYQRALKPGWHVLLPLAERVVQRVQLMGHHIAVRLPHRGTHSGNADVYFQVLEPAITGPALSRLDDLVMLEATARLADLGRDRVIGDSLSGLSRLYCDSLNSQLGRLGLRVIRCQLHLPTL